jgi:hypothetical protein
MVFLHQESLLLLKSHLLPITNVFSHDYFNLNLKTDLILTIQSTDEDFVNTAIKDRHLISCLNNNHFTGLIVLHFVLLNVLEDRFGSSHSKLTNDKIQITNYNEINYLNLLTVWLFVASL